VLSVKAGAFVYPRFRVFCRHSANPYAALCVLFSCVVGL
jgi:hypothetical protein